MRALARCVLVSFMLLGRGRIHLRSRRVGMRLHFADGSSGRVYRETVLDREPTREPCVLVVEFRLRLVRGWGHSLFRLESLLNTPLFVGFPGFVSKLWVAHDDHGVYRGLYEWDGPGAAESYARALWWVLALVSVPDIPCPSVSSGGGDLMVRGRVFVVVRARFEAAVQDADEPVRELPQRGVVADLPCAERVVVRPRAR